ncbi:class E sortase [Streptomyces sp. NBC_01525]|uniref:class E sortase n=1 Tax=Streptomyces sp. NBC_01525 TaxID=2903893 RepID=UPI0038642268
MTDTRPERDGTPQDPYGSRGVDGDPYGGDAAFEAAVGRLNDPLTDPLPSPGGPPGGTDALAGDGSGTTGPAGTANPAAGHAAAPGRTASHPSPGATPSATGTPVPDRPGARARIAGTPAPGNGSPWFRPRPAAEETPADGTPPGSATGFGPEAAAGRGPDGAAGAAQVPAFGPAGARPEAPGPSAPPVPQPTTGPVADDETMALRQAERTGSPDGGDPSDDAVSRETASGVAPVSRETEGVSRETAGAPGPGGRAARRKAAQQAAKRGGRRGKHGGTAVASAPPSPPPAPTSRLEARRAARAAKESLSLIASRAIGEVFITLGVVMLLFVTYQMWWTNVLAQQEAGGAANTLQHQWEEGGGEKKSPASGERFAIMYIPKLDVKAPIAEGIDKHSVLDRGMVGHYGKASGIKTAMPWDKKGNFAVAAHRNTHGEPFRYINKLSPGDKIVVETQSTYYTYQMESILPQTSPQNVSVIQPVPQGSGFKAPGRYLTLTTCTPEFTSTYRMIVWGKMVAAQPRSKGEPDALTG